MKSVSVLLISAALVSVACAKQITSLPGYNGPPLTQYTGYIEVDASSGKNIFYWLVESQSSTPSSDPLVVWFQGGPGCSGFEALFSEHGPFVPNYDGGLDYFPLSWTNVANVLYIEQPAGVGFSYATSSRGYLSSDSISAQDNYIFLTKFLQEYPQYLGRDLWLTGESYAGVYVPNLVSLILKNVTSPLYTQLTGIALGNPVIDCEQNNVAIQFDLLYYHGLVSYQLKAKWNQLRCDQQTQAGAPCADILAQALKQIGTFYQQKRSTDETVQPNLDPDDLYQDFCTGNGTLDFAVNVDTPYPNPAQCYPLVNRVTDYLNDPNVQAAIGARPNVWSECTDNITYAQSGTSMLPIYTRLFAQRPDVRVLIFSGDVDIATVPFGITQGCLYLLRETVTDTWGPWYVNGATAGYVETYTHYTYATIKGAGHMCPQYQPLTSYNLFTRFLSGQSIIGTEEDMPKPRPSKVVTEGQRLQQSRGYGL